MKTPRLALPRGTLLVMAAHPDDEALGAGALIAAHVRSGGRAVAVFATDGDAGRPRRHRGPRLAAARRSEARRACAALGAACGDCHAAHLVCSARPGQSVHSPARRKR